MFYCCRTDVFVKLLVDIVLYKVLVDSIVQWRPALHVQAWLGHVRVHVHVGLIRS